MYTLLVADDESIERNAIRHIINTSCPKIGEIIEAVNGIDALEKCRSLSPDIVLCDIKMPGMSGLELAREIRERNKNQIIVFLTAYDYFDYAREALTLKADDYLLKPADSSRIVSLVNSLINKIENQNEVRKNLEEKEKRLALLTNFFNNEYLATLLDQNSTSFLAEFQEMLPSWMTECIVAAVRIDFSPFPFVIADTAQKELLHRRALLILKNEIEIRLYTFLVHEREDIIFFVLFPLGEETSQYSSPASIYDLFTSIAQLIQSRLSLNLTTALAGAKNNPTAIQDALVKVLKAQKEKGMLNDVIMCEPSFEETGLPAIQKLPPRLTKVLEDVMQRIEKEYMLPLSLESVSSSIQLSSFYFSKVFKQFRGMTFIDCLNDVRIKHARILLQDPLSSIKQIAAMTGYSDPNYFSRVFKNMCGDTPSEFRNKIMR